MVTISKFSYENSGVLSGSFSAECILGRAKEPDNTAASSIDGSEADGNSGNSLYEM